MGCSQSPRERRLGLGETRRGACSEAFPGGVKAELTHRLTGIYNTTKGGAKPSSEREQHEQRLGV